MNTVAYIITIVLLVGALVLEKILNHKVVAELHDRLAAKDLADFKYHQKLEPVELEHNEKVLKLQREKIEAGLEAEKKMTPAEKELREIAKEY